MASPPAGGDPAGDDELWRIAYAHATRDTPSPTVALLGHLEAALSTPSAPPLPPTSPPSTQPLTSALPLPAPLQPSSVLADYPPPPSLPASRPYASAAGAYTPYPAAPLRQDPYSHPPPLQNNPSPQPYAPQYQYPVPGQYPSQSNTAPSIPYYLPAPPANTSTALPVPYYLPPPPANTSQSYAPVLPGPQSGPYQSYAPELTAPTSQSHSAQPAAYSAAPQGTASLSYPHQYSSRTDGYYDAESYQPYTSPDQTTLPAPGPTSQPIPNVPRPTRRKTADFTASGSEKEPTHEERLQGNALSRVWVQDGGAANAFSDPEALDRYLGLFPEADNDQGCRVFRYGPDCATRLLMPLLVRLDFSRFSQFPYGVSGNYAASDLWGSGSCTCPRCYDGRLCGHYVLHKNLQFYLAVDTISPPSSSPTVTTEAGVMSISAGSNRYDFYKADWNLQLFRFRSRKGQTTEFAHDALVYQNYDLEIKAKALPLDYVFAQLDVVLASWDSVLTASLQFLASFRVEVLEERLGTDRTIIRNLVAAAQHWEEYRRMLKVQLVRVEFLDNVYADPRWVEGRDNHFETVGLAAGYAQRLKAVDYRIQVELMQETDSLIQRVSSLISIDEGYRSRDQNESIKRLTWITFIFLPLLFTSALFSMQIDIFSTAAPWQYYVYTSLVVASLIFVGYSLLRSRRRVTAVGATILLLPFFVIGLLYETITQMKASKDEDASTSTSTNDVEKQGRDNGSDAETAAMLKWAAGSGNVEVLEAILQTAFVGASGASNKKKGKKANLGASGPSLVMAIQNGHTEAAKLLIETTKEDGVLYQDDQGSTPLHWAAKGGYSSICRALLEHGAQRNARNFSGETPLDWAMQGRDEKTINLLLKGGNTKFTRMDTLNLQSLHFSARVGDLDAVKDLHRHGANLEMRDGKGQTVLFHAVKGGQRAIIEWLLGEAHANVQAIDKEGYTALHIAAQACDDKSASLLIRHGADVNALSNLHLTPLHLISDSKGVNVLTLLCENGADINAETRDGARLVHTAAGTAALGGGGGGGDLLEAAGERGADLTAKGPAGNTPAHLAAACGGKETLEFLRRRAVDITDGRNEAGYTPLMLAAQNRRHDAMNYLLGHGASHAVADAQGRSLVELSIGWGDPAVMSILRSVGADYSSWGATGSTGGSTAAPHPVWTAVREGQPGAAAALGQLLATGGLSAEYAYGEAGVRLLQLALECGRLEAASVLLEHGAGVRAGAEGAVVDAYGWTALHSAAFSGDVALVRLVMQHLQGVDGDDDDQDRAARDHQGWTPLDLAAFYGYEEVVKVLDPEGKVTQYAWMIKASTAGAAAAAAAAAATTTGMGVNSTDYLEPPVADSVIPNIAEAPGDLA